MRALSPTHLKLGQRIKELRRGLDITQEELAFKVEIDRSYMGFLERGERNPTLSTLVRLARALRVSLRELVE